MSKEETESKDRPLHPSEIAKNEAETKKLLAEAEAALLTAESAAAKSNAEAAKALVEVRLAEQVEQEQADRLVLVGFERERAEEKRQEELAAHKYYHVYTFDMPVAEASVKKCIAQLTQWERTVVPGEFLTVTLELNSPGGDVVEGFALIDFIEGMKSRGHVINTIAYGMAASMAGVILEVGTTRTMGKNAVLLIHEASFGAVGSYGEVEDRLKLVDIFHDKILDLFTARSNVTKTFIKRNWSRRDWWLPADLALKHGFCDDLQ